MIILVDTPAYEIALIPSNTVSTINTQTYGNQNYANHTFDRNERERYY